ncbi:hypothetical protein J6590_063979 [Homalodisca vitripennis]|nr:hypothetical protein J6590_063979 [Homalodisca vitripennis]
MVTSVSAYHCQNQRLGPRSYPQVAIWILTSLMLHVSPGCMESVIVDCNGSRARGWGSAVTHGYVSVSISLSKSATRPPAVSSGCMESVIVDCNGSRARGWGSAVTHGYVSVSIALSTSATGPWPYPQVAIWILTKLMLTRVSPGCMESVIVDCNGSRARGWGSAVTHGYVSVSISLSTSATGPWPYPQVAVWILTKLMLTRVSPGCMEIMIVDCNGSRMPEAGAAQ